MDDAAGGRPEMVQNWTSSLPSWVEDMDAIVVCSFCRGRRTIKIALGWNPTPAMAAMARNFRRAGCPERAPGLMEFGHMGVEFDGRAGPVPL